VDTQDTNEERYVPFEGPRGWGIAFLVVALAAALAFVAHAIYKSTYRNPRDPTTISSLR
jgi:hypothetical protein